mgnify:CR=1 FL=1
MAVSREYIMVKKCIIQACDKPLYAKKICKNHYELNRIRGRTYKIRGTPLYQRPVKCPKIIEKCIIDQCNNPSRKLKMCNSHYQLKLSGRTHKKFERTPNGTSIEERLKNKSKYNPENACIEWISTMFNNGYGQITINRVKKSAHVASWEFHNKKSANGYFIMHKCDNKKCINPEHLMLGTNSLNQKDKILKNRQAKGTDFPSAKLNDDKVREIHKLLNSGMKQTEIAKIYNIDQSIISEIKSGKRWKHVEVSQCQ